MWGIMGKCSDMVWLGWGNIGKDIRGELDWVRGMGGERE